MEEQDKIIKLQNRIKVLEQENKKLKSLLSGSGISFEEKCNESDNEETIDDRYDPDQGSRIKKYNISNDTCRSFYYYFRGRDDVYALRYENRNTGKSGYSKQCVNLWKFGACPKKNNNRFPCRECSNFAGKKLNSEVIEAHLSGRKEDCSDVIGLYPVFKDNTCYFIVFDFDDHGDDQNNDGWKQDVKLLRKICEINKVPYLVERSRSGNGGHVWIFFSEPIDASLARKFGFALLNRGMDNASMESFKYFDRIIPAQDEIVDGGYGNLIALPLQGKAIEQGNSTFIDEDFNAYEDQWEKLFSTRRLSKSELQACIDKWNINDKKEFTDEEKPWDRSEDFYLEDINGILKITLSDRVYINKNNLEPRLKNRVRRLALLSNPAYYKNIALGKSNYNETRYIYLGEDDNDYICLPRGVLDELKQRCDAAGIEYTISDKRALGRKINVEFKGELTNTQRTGLEQLLKYDNGILEAYPGFGKTVASLNIIARKKVSTLILLHKTSLIKQWQDKIKEFLVINEECPEYTDKNGKNKRRKSVIGLIHGEKDTSTGIIDIAMVGSLRKNGIWHERLKEYGLVIVDEAHHVASETISSVLMQVKARYVYGVTATSKRYDGLEKINFLAIGPKRFSYTGKNIVEERSFDRLLVPRFTSTAYPHGKERIDTNKAYELIRNNEIRNDMIVEDVLSALKGKRTILVLSKFKDHAQLIYNRLLGKAHHVLLLTGSMSKKEQREVLDKLDKINDEESLVLAGTGQLIGEGFNYPRLDTLFIVAPISFEGVVEQYTGRLNRDYEGKKDVIVYDYIDINIPVLEKMYRNRLKSYKNLGYKIMSEKTEENLKTVNSIYDFESYYDTYENDLTNARNEIVVSSPTLAKNKVFNFLSLTKQLRENGVKVSVVTWHPDSYRYGSDENRIFLLETLRNAGIHIELVEENCERYTIIDREVVWYGTLNFLSKEDIDDSIIRLTDKNIAEELLNVSFGKDSTAKEYGTEWES